MNVLASKDKETWKKQLHLFRRKPGNWNEKRMEVAKAKQFNLINVEERANSYSCNGKIIT